MLLTVFGLSYDCNTQKLIVDEKKDPREKKVDPIKRSGLVISLHCKHWSTDHQKHSFKSKSRRLMVLYTYNLL